jgi:hypothetical protein
MPLWAYNISPPILALIMLVVVGGISLAGLFLARRFLLPRLQYHDGINDAVGGTVQAIGVFYGITVGLIAVGAWNTTETAYQLVSNEATAVVTLYRDVSGYPPQIRDELRSGLLNYTRGVIERDWPAQREGRSEDSGIGLLDELQSKLYAFEPSTAGQEALHAETLRAFNNLAQQRRLRVHALAASLSDMMWTVIWIGAAFSISVAYLFNIEDPKMHALLVGLMAGFLSIVLFMIVVNDRPFYGYVCVSPEPYQQVLDRMIALAK